MTWQMTSLGLTSAGESRRVVACDDALRVLAARGAHDQPYRNFEGRVGVHAVSDDVESFTVL